jgi:hypothetical protein
MRSSCELMRGEESKNDLRGCCMPKSRLRFSIPIGCRSTAVWWLTPGCPRRAAGDLNPRDHEALAFFRLTRSGTFTIKNAGYVLSSQSIGASRMRILLRHILPNLSSTLLVFITLRLGTMVLAGSGLSFIGLGVQPPNADWGAMLTSSKSLLGQASWLVVFPGLVITMFVLGFEAGSI